MKKYTLWDPSPDATSPSDLIARSKEYQIYARIRRKTDDSWGQIDSNLFEERLQERMTHGVCQALVLFLSRLING